MYLLNDVVVFNMHVYVVRVM